MSALDSQAVGVGPSRFAALRGRARKADPLLIICATICVLLVLMAIFGPLIAPYPPDEPNILAANQSAGGAHLLGTDALGRDIFSRLLYGARLSLFGPAMVIALATTFGTAIAIGAVWFGGRVERFTARALDMVFAFPSLIFAILAAAIFGAGLWTAVISLSIAYTPYIARVVQSVARRERNLPYVDACQLAGLSGRRICGRHILPNVRGVVAAQATIGFGSALVDLSALSFLGLGVKPPSSEWGLMVSEGSTPLLNGYPQEAFAAGAAIVIAVVAFNVLGERVAARGATAR